jgi:hypothetical protein
MVKRKLLLVAGAGATIDFGMPSVADIDKILSKHSHQWFPLADDLNSNLYLYNKGVLDNYFQLKTGRVTSNFEDVLYATSLLASSYPSGPYVTSIFAMDTIPDIIFPGNERRQPTNNDLQTFGHMSVDEILERIRECCRTIEANKSAKSSG